MRSRNENRNSARRALGALVVGFAAALVAAGSASRADDRYTVCSATINSSDEIATFRKYLPESKFRFVELTDAARSSADGDDTPWFTKACRSGFHCDVLVVSGHFGNTWAGNFGTTFAGESGLTLSLEDLERRTCDNSCGGVLRDPLEVFLFGCRTLAAGLPDRPLPAEDLARLAKNGVPPETAERIADEARYRGSDTSNRLRMRFVFAGAPEIYGFSSSGPSGERVRPLLENYLRSVGDYAAHLDRLAARRAAQDTAPFRNEEIARALQPSSFDQCSGFALTDTDYLRGGRICFLKNEQNPLTARLEHVHVLLDDPGFLNYLPAIKSFLREHPPASLGPAEVAALKRIREHSRARDRVIDLIGTLKSPLLKLELVSVARAVGWMDDGAALRVQRNVLLRVLRPPLYGEGRDLVCGIDPDLIRLVEIRAEDLRPELYKDEYGIQALACLKPADERIHEQLAKSLFDSREWIAQNAAIALMKIKPSRVDVQVALARQLNRPEPGAREWAGEALREIKAADPRVLETIRETAPSFRIDWLSAAPGPKTSGGSG